MSDTSDPKSGPQARPEFEPNFTFEHAARKGPPAGTRIPHNCGNPNHSHGLAGLHLPAQTVDQAGTDTSTSVAQNIPSGPAPDPRENERWMRRALELAADAASAGEIPIGAVIVFEGQIIAESGNLKEATQDPLGHAEVLVIRDAAQKLGRWRLTGCTLYVTLEPCTMCAGAIVHARLDRLVYATPDPKAGAVHSLYQILADQRLNHGPAVTSGVLRDEASLQLKTFFRKLRSRS